MTLTRHTISSHQHHTVTYGRHETNDEPPIISASVALFICIYKQHPTLYIISAHLTQILQHGHPHRSTQLALRAHPILSSVVPGDQRRRISWPYLQSLHLFVASASCHLLQHKQPSAPLLPGPTRVSISPRTVQRSHREISCLGLLRAKGLPS